MADDSSSADVTTLRSVTGNEFDRIYMRMMVDDHEKAVALFISASQSNDTEVRAFAVKTLPTLKEHLTHARTISLGRLNYFKASIKGAIGLTVYTIYLKPAL